MGAEPYWYVVDYQPDVESALQALRQREFEAGRYSPITPSPQFPITADSPAPGAGHASIEEAIEASEEDGTCSILDLMSIGPEPEFCMAGPVSDERLIQLFKTTQPSRDLPDFEEHLMEVFEDLDRGHGVYMILYKDDEPNEILFAGYSFD